MISLKSATVAAVALPLLCANAVAGPFNAAPATGASAAGQLTPVEWRGRGGGGWGLPGALLGLGVGVAVGSIIADRTYRPRPGHYYDEAAYDGPYYYPSDFRGDPREICAQNFRTFEWRTGLYTTYSGEKRLCPYLR